MPDGGDQRVGADHHVVADIDLPDVQQGQVVVAGEVVADVNVPAVVTVEGLGDPHALAHMAQMFLQHGPLGVKVQGIQGVELLAPDDGLLLEPIHLLIVVAVFQTGAQFLQFGHPSTLISLLNHSSPPMPDGRRVTASEEHIHYSFVGNKKQRSISFSLLSPTNSH